MEDKVHTILALLAADAPASSTGKIIRAFLVDAVPKMSEEQLDKVMLALGVPDETP